jgi:Family of unknown function (DUF6152)
MKLCKWVSFGAALSVLSVSAALAHHSNAMFDDTKDLEVAGTVYQFQWTNPHIFIELMVDGPNGPYKYIIEGPTPGVLRAHDWKFNSIKPGDKVVAHVRPLREGRVGGYLVSLAKDGKPIGDGGASSATIKGYK